MDPRLLAILAAHGLTASADEPLDLASLDDETLGALARAFVDEAHSRLENADTDPDAALALEDVAEAVLAEIEARPSITAAALGQLAGRLDQRTRPVPTRLGIRREQTEAAAQRRAAAVAERDRALVETFATGLRDASRGSVNGLVQPDGSVRLATLRARDDVPALGQDPIANRSLIAAGVDQYRTALVAAGGLCSTVEQLYDVPVAATTERPVRGALVPFTASRGGVRYLPPPTLADVAAGVTVWTEANDTTPGSDGPSTKPIVSMSCPTELEVRVHAVPARMRIGNFTAMFHEEHVDAWLTALMAHHARIAEQELLEQIDAGSTMAVTGQLLGTTPDVLATVDRATAQLRDRLRVDDTAQVIAILPSWLRAMIRTDLARRLPGDDTLSVTNEQINRLFLSRFVSPVWSLDAEPMTDTQGDGAPLNGWPSTVKLRMFTPGSWLFLDGGQLDLGVIRDSTLNQTNSAETFAETFEAAAFVGTESLLIEADVVPDGAVAGTVDIDVSSTGS